MATTLGKAYVQIIPSAKGIKGSIGSLLNGEASQAGDEAGERAGISLASKMKKIIARAAIGAVVAKGIKSAMSEGTQLEQSIGGIETLFKGSAGKMKEYAAQAYKTAGMSANEYMQQSTSFAASLIQSTGGNTKKAASTANMALIDMSDNANKMGTSMDLIQNAYQGFAKQNYTMLDNLKLGYGGTKTEMQRLLADAQKLTGQKYDINNLNDVYSAIHVVQKQLGITGTTSKEAAHTMEGSFNSMKAAGKDLLGNLALGKNIRPSMRNFASAVSSFLFGNFFPMLGNILKGIPTMVVTFITTGVPKIVAGVRSLFSKIIQFVSTRGPHIAQGIRQAFIHAFTWIKTNGPALVSSIVGKFNALQKIFSNIDTAKIAAAAGKAMKKFGRGIVKYGPSVLKAFVKIILAIIKAIGTLALKLLVLGGRLLLFLGKGILKMATYPIRLIASLIAKMIVGIGKGIAKFASGGGRLILSLARGIVGGIGSAISAIARVVSGIISKAGEVIGRIKDVGWNIVKGIGEGITSGVTWIKNRIQEFVGNVLGFLKKLFKINSPSRLMRDEIGFHIAAGVGEGIAGNVSAVKSAMEKLKREAITNFTPQLSAKSVSVKGMHLRNGLGDNVVNGLNTILQANSDPTDGTINIINYLYPSGAKMEEEIVKAYNRGTQKLGINYGVS